MSSSMESSFRSFLISTSKGIYCRQGDFYIDPLRSVERALITHAHSDHARPGSRAYLTAREGELVLRARLGASAKIETLEYGQAVTINGVTVSFHPAGHVLGSAQIRLEYKGYVCVVSGDYKTKFDSTCKAFELVPCHCFVSESTFGLPIFQWPDSSELAGDMNLWWQSNRRDGLASVIYAYSFGKAQRLLSLLDGSIGNIFVHRTIQEMNRQYIASGVNLRTCSNLPDFSDASAGLASRLLSGSLLILPPGAKESRYLADTNSYSSAFVSGWTCMSKMQRLQNYQRGFVLSDHADWNELLTVIKATGAGRILITHGYIRPLIEHLNAQGFNADSLKAELGGQDYYGDN